MNKTFLTFLTCLLISCLSQNKNPDQGRSDTLVNKEPIDKPIQTFNHQIIDTLINKLPVETIKVFDIDKYSDDNLDNEKYKLNKELVDYFYSTEELKYYHDYFNFKSFIYGKLPKVKGLIPVLILNSNFETAIYLDCFLINDKGEIIDMFRPSYLEGQPSYSFVCRGKFIADTIYQAHEFEYETLDDVTGQVKKDSLIIQLMMNENGIYFRDTLARGIDTTVFHENGFE